ncbi:hypothetical protein N656DRAFT_286242 [Canariomyces notabilis]|uniref:Uncharacterized protein n=1 Tax=Canariomyces notabilis TaxID=2074819 RepID=A0AAN6T9Y3_9PEZI|nr:hypothetical protein N656DRAFT_286242 [Canariomyces arenarius]
MVQSLRSVALSALCILPYTTTAYQDNVKAGPNALDECAACPRMYTYLYRCQQISQPGRVGNEVHDCLCDRSDNGWYAYIDACAGCLGNAAEGDDDFFSSMRRMMWTTYSVCRDQNGNITSDGFSLCANNGGNYEDCLSLKDSSQGETWVSFRAFKLVGATDSNHTQLLNLAEVKKNLTITSTTLESTSATTATASDTAAATTTTATGTDGQAASTTTGSGGTTTTTGTSSAARLCQGSQAGYVLGVLIVAGMVGLV